MTGFWDLSISITLNNLEFLKKRFLVNFWQFWDAAHISALNCDETAFDRPRQLHMKFLPVNVDFSGLSPDPLGFWRPSQASVKDSYFPKKWLFYCNYLV